ncbi:breast cancer 2 susceptibility protein [Clonorchis sinensis]|uniref:Breast cancer 2 susceptibility protein n=1 Tax=Clonorchis sinensis TaxID=79923 RepID=G7YE82_CLOSI|nr:breast cancer 2 susceptibility protein [Clonorchis sinensis]
MLPECPVIVAGDTLKLQHKENLCPLRFTQEFDDSLSGISWTQVLATSVSPRKDLPNSVPIPPAVDLDHPVSSTTAPTYGSPTVLGPMHSLFMTAGGMRISLPSTEAMQNARRLLRDDLVLEQPKQECIPGLGMSNEPKTQNQSQCDKETPEHEVECTFTTGITSTGISDSNDAQFTGFISAKGVTLLLRTNSSKDRARSLLSPELPVIQPLRLGCEDPSLHTDNSMLEPIQPLVPSDYPRATCSTNQPTRSPFAFDSEVPSYSTTEQSTPQQCVLSREFITVSDPSFSESRKALSVTTDLQIREGLGEAMKFVPEMSSSVSQHIPRVPEFPDTRCNTGSHSDTGILNSSPEKCTESPLPLTESDAQPLSTASPISATVEGTAKSIQNKSAFSAVNLLYPTLRPHIPEGFVKASGNKIEAVSGAALQRANQLFVSELDRDGPNTTAGLVMDRQKTRADVKHFEVPSPENLLHTRAHLTFTGFVRASGRSVDPVSETSIEHAKQLCANDMEDVSPSLATTSHVPVSTTWPSKTDTVQAAQKPIHSHKTATSGFKSASGHEVPYSEESLKRARQLYLSEEFTDHLNWSGVLKKDQSPPATLSAKVGSSADVRSSLGVGTLASLAPPLPEAEVVVEPDSLTALLEDSQFQDVRTWLHNNDLERTDSALEARRQQLRSEQREILANKLELPQPNRSENSGPKVLSRQPGQNPVSSLYCPGSLWRLRAACRQATTERSPLIPLNHMVAHESSPKRTQKHDKHVGSFDLPDNIHFPVNTDRWSLRTAAQLRWQLDRAYLLDPTAKPSLPASYEAGDGGVLIPDAYGCVGKEEIIDAFLASPSVCCQLVSRGWLSNHYDQLVWKLGSTTLRASLPDSPFRLPVDYFTPHHVLLRLKYRYDRELEQVERPALRRIVELDDTPARRLVLCVSEVTAIGSSQFNVRVTDGWYQVNCQLDGALIRLVRSGRIRVGTKFVTAGAELVHIDAATGASVAVRSVKCSGEDSQYGHLFGADGAAMGVSLRLHGNSTRPCPWFTRLGYSFEQPSSWCGSYPVPLCTLLPDGGLCSGIRVVVQRRFPLQYMETLEDLPESANERDRRSPGLRRHLFRSERAEQAEVAQFEQQRRRALDQALDNLIPTGRGTTGRKQPTPSQLASLGTDGEALFAAVMGALDPTEAESELSDVQRDAMRQFKETTLRSAMDEVTKPRKVTPLLRVRVAGLHPKDVSLNYVVPVTFWNPTDDLLAVLKEGEAVEIYKLQATTTRTTDPFAPPSAGQMISPVQRAALLPGATLALSGGRNTSARPLVSSARKQKAIKSCLPSDVVDEKLIERVYRPRNAMSVADVQHIYVSNSSDFHAPLTDQNTPIEVDLRCIVVAVHQSHATDISLRTKSDPKTVEPSTAIGQRSTASEVDSVYVTDANSSSDGCLVVVKIWGGLQTHHLSNLLQKGQAVHFTDLQLRRRQQLPSVPVLDPELGSKSFTLISLNYTVASNVTVDKLLTRTPRSRLSNEKSSCLSPHLERLAEMHWSSYSTPVSKRYPGLNLFDRCSSTPMRTGVGRGLSSLLQSTGKTESTPIGKATNQPTISAVGGAEKEPKAMEQMTPLRSLATRTTPRTGLSRRARRPATTSLAINNPPTLNLKMAQTFNTPVQNARVSPPNAEEPSAMGTVLKQPLSTLLSEDPLLATPEPKRRRVASPESPKPCSPKTLENKENMTESFGSILEDTFELPHSPVYTSDTPTCNPPSTPASIRSRTTEFNSPSFSGPDSSDDMEVSIADLVKTRRRSTRSLQASSTPTRTRFPNFRD